MTFIVTLIALVIERFFHWNHSRRWRWFLRFQRWMGRYRGVKSSYQSLALCILPLLITVGVIDNFLSGWLYGFFEFAFGVVILLYCFGPDNLWLQTYTSINQLHKEDPEIAIETVKAAFGVSAPHSSLGFHQAFTAAILTAGYQRVFAVVFWFVVFGPVGAVLYRSISLCAEESPLGVSSSARYIQKLLDWLPMRVLVFLFALGGNFSNVFSLWKRFFKERFSSNVNLVAICGAASLDPLSEEGAAEKDALSLLDRAFMIGLAILATLQLIALS